MCPDRYHIHPRTTRKASQACFSSLLFIPQGEGMGSQGQQLPGVGGGREGGGTSSHGPSAATWGGLHDPGRPLQRAGLLWVSACRFQTSLCLPGMQGHGSPTEHPGRQVPITSPEDPLAPNHCPAALLRRPAGERWDQGLEGAGGVWWARLQGTTGVQGKRGQH